MYWQWWHIYEEQMIEWKFLEKEVNSKKEKDGLKVEVAKMELRAIELEQKLIEVASNTKKRPAAREEVEEGEKKRLRVEAREALARSFGKTWRELEQEVDRLNK